VVTNVDQAPVMSLAHEMVQAGSRWMTIERCLEKSHDPIAQALWELSAIARLLVRLIVIFSIWPRVNLAMSRLKLSKFLRTG